MKRGLLSALTAVFLVAVGPAWHWAEAAPLPQAHYAALAYDVVYVRCPRGREPMMRGSKPLLNTNGVNDLWLSASNNIVQEPGCDLVLHHSDRAYKHLPPGARGREEVLVDCDETDGRKSICTVADPNVSFDGRRIVYAKWLDTRSFISDPGLYGDEGWAYQRHGQSQVDIFPDGHAPSGHHYVEQIQGGIMAYAAPAFIFEYDLTTHTERRVSPDGNFFAGRAYPGKAADWHGSVPVMDTGPVYIGEDKIAFTSNRESGFYRFSLFTMDTTGRNMEWIGHRAVAQQLHPFILKDGRIGYTSKDTMLEKGDNNNYSLFTINPDGSDPFILAGKHDSTMQSYHFATQLSDGDIVVDIYYNHNNTGLGTFLRFPIDPPGPDFVHLAPRGRAFDPSRWQFGNSFLPFARVGQYTLFPEASAGDSEAAPLPADARWRHPDGHIVISGARFAHPAAAPGDALLTTYCIGGCSTMSAGWFNTTEYKTYIGKDAGIWYVPKTRGAVPFMPAVGRLVVDFPDYHEIMARAVVPYKTIYGVDHPPYLKATPNDGTDVRLTAGEAAGLVGASSLYDRETRALNGTPWNMSDGGGHLSGRTYTNLASSGAELAIFDNAEVAGVRVVAVQVPNPLGVSGGSQHWAGGQQHHLRILGEFPVRKFTADGKPMMDAEGHPDTSFMVKVPADTPFLLQSIDKNGMALDIETAARTVAPGERQVCSGCHYHTKQGQNFSTSYAANHAEIMADVTGPAKLFDGIDRKGQPTSAPASAIYAGMPGVSARRSFAVDWKNQVAPLIQRRCASCHGEGRAAQQQTGLRLDGDERTYELLTRNQYRREDGVTVTGKTPVYSCCIVSRWLSILSARSSMLVWAMYGARLDGRDPATGLPPAGSGVLVDNQHREHPDTWPGVAAHAAYVADMPEAEKRLIARWIDLGAPKLNAADDMQRPVLALRPVREAGGISKVLVGVWDDSMLDYGRFVVRRNGRPFMTGADIKGRPPVITVQLPTPVTAANQDREEYSFEIWDRPDRSLSLVDPGVPAANRLVRTVTGRGLESMLGEDSTAPR